MSAQLSLFGPASTEGRARRIARRSDVDTSHIAAEEHISSGRAASHAAAVLELVKSRPGLTAAEIGRITALGHVEAQRRLSDLKRDGLLEMGARVECPVTGSQMRTWLPAAEASS